MKHKRKQSRVPYIKFHWDPLSDFFAGFLLELGAFRRCWPVALVRVLIGHQRNVFKIAALICSQKSLAQFTGNMSDLGQVLWAFCVWVTSLVNAPRSWQQSGGWCSGMCSNTWSPHPVTTSLRDLLGTLFSSRETQRLSAQWGRLSPVAP